MDMSVDDFGINEDALIRRIVLLETLLGFHINAHVVAACCRIQREVRRRQATFYTPPSLFDTLYELFLAYMRRIASWFDMDSVAVSLV